MAKQNKKIKIYIEIAIIFILIVASIFIFLKITDNESGDKNLSDSGQISNLTSNRANTEDESDKINVFKILDGLQKFGNWPVESLNPKSTPRSNPFVE